jgi:hypothetical protein
MSTTGGRTLWPRIEVRDSQPLRKDFETLPLGFSEFVKTLCAFGIFSKRIHLILLRFPSWHTGCSPFGSARSGFVLWGPDHRPGKGGRDEEDSLGCTTTSRRNPAGMGRPCQRNMRKQLHAATSGSRTRNAPAPRLWPCWTRWRGLETAPPEEVVLQAKDLLRAPTPSRRSWD